MFLCWFRRFFRKLFITAAFALPNWKYQVRLSFVFIDRPSGRHNLPSALRADTAARRAPLNIDLKLFGYVSHRRCGQAARGPGSSFSIAKRDVKDRGENCYWRRQQHNYANVQIPCECLRHGRATKSALSENGRFCKCKNRHRNEPDDDYTN